VPAGKIVMTDAEPLTTEPIPSVAAPLLNVTVPPVGMFKLAGLVTTLAVKTSAWPKVKLLAEDATEIKVGTVSNCRTSSGMTVKAIRLSRCSFTRWRFFGRREFNANQLGESCIDMIVMLLRFSA
jgi:hypothetical protein